MVLSVLPLMAVTMSWLHLFHPSRSQSHLPC